MPQAKKGSRSLKRALRQNIQIQGLEDEHFRYLYAAYKEGSLVSLGETFVDTSLEPAEFREALTQELVHTYHGAWVVAADTSKGFLPVGLVLGFFSHPDPAKSPFMIVGDMVWFPWATARRRVEAAVRFFHEVRAEFPFVEYADLEAKPFFELIARHGVLRRVGTSYNVYPDQPTAIFETRRA